MSQNRATRHLLPHAHLGATFGTDRFGTFAERFARGFGAPRFLVVQTLAVIGWIAWNAATHDAFDPFPFILLNLAFSTQAAYAAPLILLAQTRQAERDRAWTDADAHHREELSASTLKLLVQNTSLTQSVSELLQRNTTLTEELRSLLRQNTVLTQQVHDLSRHIDGLTGEIHARIAP
ncbi:MAG: DUF1003 domain-containing protein [Dehalococcoidia bacterium]|nr:DUF1003 domain-containing protein [Dehalococcoidia bacterium]MDP2328538.1 DUF1003 domain-containing protein [Dehalococcoidia bacterium]